MEWLSFSLFLGQLKLFYEEYTYTYTDISKNYKFSQNILIRSINDTTDTEQYHV